MDLSGIFKAYDVRGVYPSEINEDVVERIGAAFAKFAGSGELVVGRDMRSSSVPLVEAFSRGVASQGVDVMDVGLVSTDGLYFASGRYGLPGAMFTASHNPGQYNGIKFCLAGAAPVGRDTGLAEIRAMAEGDGAGGPGGGKIAQRDVVEEFVEHLLGMIDVSTLRPLKVAVDAANGMGGKVFPPLAERLPIEVVPLYFELDGTFPNHPADPIQTENLKDLRAAVLSTGADLGLAFDGDADRVFLVDERAEPVTASVTAAVVAARVLAKEPGASIVYNLICSRVVPETIVENGGKPVKTRVGHSFVKKVMADTGAAFGGEHSGHYYFRDNFRADSGLICALNVMEALSAEARPMSEVLAPYRRYWNSGELNTETSDQEGRMKALASEFGDGAPDWTDGLTVEYGHWWFNARPSNTEPLLRVNVEAEEPSVGEAKTARILEIIKEAR